MLCAERRVFFVCSATDASVTETRNAKKNKLDNRRERTCGGPFRENAELGWQRFPNGLADGARGVLQAATVEKPARGTAAGAGATSLRRFRIGYRTAPGRAGPGETGHPSKPRFRNRGRRTHGGFSG